MPICSFFFVVSVTFSSYWERACLVVITVNREEIDHIHSLLLSLLHGSHKTLVIDSMVLIVNVSGVLLLCPGSQRLCSCCISLPMCLGVDCLIR